MTSTTLCDIAIVGGGPVGIALANLLGQHGLDVVVLERHPDILDIPRAVHFDGETMRIFQAMGLAREVLDISRPGHGMHWVNADGHTLAIREGVTGLGDQGWHNDYYFHQPQLEAVLRKGLARFDSVRLLSGTAVHAHTADADGVTLAFTRLADGCESTLRCRYVVGCDGARSLVRAWIGDHHEDLGQHQAWLVVDGVLEHPLPLPEHTIQLCDPARPATSIYVHPLRRRWELLVLPDEDIDALVRPDRVWQLLERWVRPTQARLERATVYVFHSLLAQSWQSGRLLLAGDAAHQTPPFLGQGLCAGMRDAANLAWKLAFAMRDGCDTLLATYGPERYPHAREFIDLAVRMGKILQITDPAQAAERDARLLAEGLSFQFPRPTLGAGAHHGPAPAGTVFIQPLLPDGRWFDDVAGQRFALVAPPEWPAALDAAAQRRLRDLPISLITDYGDQTAAWLHSHDCAAALVRPDRYVFETVRTPEQLAEALIRLEGWLRPAGVPTRDIGGTAAAEPVIHQ